MVNMSLQKEYTFSALGPLNYGAFSEAHMLTQEKWEPTPIGCSDWDIVNQSNGPRLDGIIRNWSFDDATLVYDDARFLDLSYPFRINKFVQV